MQLYLPIAEVSVNAFLILGLGGIVVAFDPAQLRRAVINVIANASEAMVGKGEDLRIDQPIMHDQPGTRNQPRGAQRQQVRRTGACANQIDRADCHCGQMARARADRQRKCFWGRVGKL